MSHKFHSEQRSINASGIYVDTDSDILVIEYSLCRGYVRVLDVVKNKTGHWRKVSCITHRSTFSFLPQMIGNKYHYCIRFRLFGNK